MISDFYFFDPVPIFWKFLSKTTKGAQRSVLENKMVILAFCIFTDDIFALIQNCS